MQLHVLTGDDDLAIRARRAALLVDSAAAADAVERFDLTTDAGSAGLLSSAGAMSLFGGPRLLEASPADQLTVATATALAQVGALSDATIVIHGGTLNAAAKKALADVGTFEPFAAPRTAGAQTARLVELAAESGITLSAQSRELLIERAGHDVPRAASVLSQCALIGLLEPTPAHLDRLLGTANAPGVPWALTDALEAGDLSTALLLADTLEPVAVISYLGSRTGQLGRIVEDGLSTPGEAASAFGVHTVPAQKLIRLAHRLGPRGIADTWDIIASADRAVKSGRHQQAALEIALCHIGRLWAPVGRHRHA
jgi:DNA polymerase III delta subunit